MNLLWIVLIPLVAAPLAALSERLGRNQSAWTTAVIVMFSLALLFLEAPAVFDGEVVRANIPWVPSLGLSLNFMLDGLGLLFALLILGMGLLIVLYARYYLSPDDPMGRFFGFLLLFLGSMLGIVLSENLILLLVFWELTSLSSFLLIGYWSHRADARQGARTALAVTGAGGLALLAGFLLLGDMGGSYSIPVLIELAPMIQDDPRFETALVLVLIGVFTKSAQFPFHFWLPGAMAAPTPVSAYLHSATMVKAGVFLLARLFPVFSGTDAWFFLVGGIGLATLLFGAYTALFKHDLKGLLAYSTISHLGLITLLFGMGTPLSAVAGLFHIINHAIFKASLFMAAGIIDHETGTRDMRKINGLWKYMPHTATLAMVAAGSMAGVPLLNGFLSKEMFFSETLALSRLGDYQWILPTLATLSGVFAVAYSARFVHDVFFNGEPIDLPRSPHEPPRYMKIPVEILVGLVLLVGVFPNFTVNPILEVAAVSVVAGPLPDYKLDVWHGFNLPLMMSILAFLGGVLLYSQRQLLFNLHDRLLPRVSGDKLFDSFFRHSVSFARAATLLVENGSLQRSLLLIILTALAAAAAPFFLGTGLGGELFEQRVATPIDPVSMAAWLVLVLSTLAATVWHRRRFLALVALGVAGLVVSLTFTRLSAPDLALTQLTVEVVTLILLLLALYLLPHTGQRDSGNIRRLRDVVVATTGGGAAAVLAWLSMTQQQQSISEYFIDYSKPEGGGSNIVNVILVDFRGFDTLGEITVLAIAALTIFALLSGLKVQQVDAPEHGHAWASDAHPLVLNTVSRLLLPLALLVSMFLLLRGHNQPGGGFIAGLVTAIALIIQYLAAGGRWAKSRMFIGHRPMIAWGLIVAAGTGMVSLIFGAPFLTSAHTHLHIPLIGDVEVASAMAFDIGVFLTVVGAVMLTLARLGHVTSGPDSVAAGRSS